LICTADYFLQSIKWKHTEDELAKLWFEFNLRAIAMLLTFVTLKLMRIYPNCATRRYHSYCK